LIKWLLEASKAGREEASLSRGWSCSPSLLCCFKCSLRCVQLERWEGTNCLLIKSC